MRNIIITALLFIPCLCFGQKKDKAKAIIIYQSVYRETLEQEKPGVDTMKLIIGKIQSSYKSVPYSKEQKTAFFVVPPRSLQNYAVYKNYPSAGKQTVTDNLNNIDNFCYTEDTPDFKWDLIEGDTIIGGYSCQKARTTFRGRIWTAWYSMEIPYDDGPWKLCGLPGLILSAYESKGDFIFNVIEIKNGNDEVFACDISNCIKISQKELENTKQLYYDDPAEYNQRYAKIKFGRTKEEYISMTTNMGKKKPKMTPCFIESTKNKE